MIKKALVTGAFGFVGRHVAKAAAQEGYQVTGIGHGTWTPSEARSWGVDTWHVASITNDALLTYADNPDVIFHCAGSGSVTFSMTKPYQDFERTSVGTLNVLEYIRIHCPKARLVIPSSAGVYGAVAEQPIRIDAPQHPVSPYGIHKKIAEDLCKSYAQHFGIAITIVRLFSVYGLGIRKQLLWDACVKLSAGIMQFDGTGEETRDWLHVEDAAALLLLLAQQTTAQCPVFNGGTGQSVSIKEVITVLSNTLQCKNIPSFSGHRRQGDPTHYQADITPALALGWHPTKHWRTEIAAFAEWYRKGAV